jgi:ribosomal protein S8
VTTKQQIDNLISLASFFENFFTAPATVFLLPNILYYDKLYGFPLYPTNQADFQNYAYEYLWVNVADSSIINTDIPEYAYTQAQSLPNDIVSSMINGDVCNTLQKYGYITDNQEFVLCEINFNEAFQNGLVNVISMINNEMNSEQQLLSIDPNLDKTTQQQEIINFLQNSGWNNSKSLTSYFYNKAAKVIFDQLNDYYRGQINNQLSILEQVLLATSILIMVLMLILIYYGQKILNKIYKNITILLSLIPFEKLINDEQTNFLIKKIIRE